MSEIIILDEFPIILTKDESFIPNQIAKSGMILTLPEDAVLVMAPKEKK